MLLRPSERQPFEVFMLRRSAKSAFAPDVFVFPGGTVDPDDSGEQLLARITSLDDERLSRIFRARNTPLLEHETQREALGPTQWRGLIVAALRELFEESGVLLGADALDPADYATLHANRRRLLDGEISFANVLENLSVRLDAGELELFSQWITPPSEGRRFDAHFFIARADGQHAIADRHETHDEIWIAPSTALERYRDGSYAMVYPTIKHVERLAAFDSIDALMDFAKTKPIVSIMPHTTAGDGFTLPPALEHAW